VRLRLEGCEKDNGGDFWTHVCSSSVHPVGWSASNGNPLIPPKCNKTKDRTFKIHLRRDCNH
jgi:hypothetical protein